MGYRGPRPHPRVKGRFDPSQINDAASMEVPLTNDKSIQRTARVSIAQVPMSHSLAAFACVVSIALMSCGKRPAGEGNPNPDDRIATPSTIVNSSKVDVPAEGKKFNPPLRAEQLPAGAWYCDMGTVHWAQMNEGNRTCPICKMDLKHKN
jgi:hypothetical protein